MTVKRRTVSSMVWTISATGVVFFVSLVRSVVLARLLPIDVFGVYAFATAIVETTGVLSFGLSSAFLYRGRETEDEEQAAAVHFTLSSMFSVVWACVLVASALAFTHGPLRLALLVLTLTRVGQQGTLTPKVLLIRRVTHRRLATLQIVNTFASTVVTLYLAWRDFGLWALLAVNIVTALVTIVTIYFWRPVWRPRFLWNQAVVRYFLRSGGQNLLARILQQAFERFDKIWIGWFMNDVALGLYSRAYAYGSVAVSSFAGSVSTVAGGTYAELSIDRARLSRAVSRVTGWLLRAGFLMSGVLSLTGQELITLLIGPRWLPMLPAFRILLFAFVCIAASRGLSPLLVAVGAPWELVRVRFSRFLVLVIGLSVLEPKIGIIGAAVSVFAAAFVGFGMLSRAIRSYADLSLRRLLLVPSVALASALALGFVSEGFVVGSDWLSGLVKAAVFLSVYTLVLFVWERSELENLWNTLRETLVSGEFAEDIPSAGML